MCLGRPCEIIQSVIQVYAEVTLNGITKDTWHKMSTVHGYFQSVLRVKIASLVFLFIPNDNIRIYWSQSQWYWFCGLPSVSTDFSFYKQRTEDILHMNVDVVLVKSKSGKSVWTGHSTDLACWTREIYFHKLFTRNLMPSSAFNIFEGGPYTCR